MARAEPARRAQPDCNNSLELAVPASHNNSQDSLASASKASKGESAKQKQKLVGYHQLFRWHTTSEKL